MLFKSRCYTHLWVILAFGVAGFFAAHAQAPATPPAATAVTGAPAATAAMGTMRGHIVDPSGALIPGASITITKSSGAVVTTTTADATGQYVVNDLAPGSYIVQSYVEGFAPFTSPAIPLAVGQVKRVDISMAMEVEQQNVVVTDESPQVNVEAGGNANAIVLKGADLDALSDDPDELSSELTALAGPSAGPNGGQIYIDGFTGGTLPPKSAIREIRINQNPFSAEYDRLGYGRIEILTKPGTNTLHGRAFVMGNDSLFNTGNPFLKPVPDYHSIQYNGNISGSFNKKASYTLSVEGRNIQDESIYIASTAVLNTTTGLYSIPTDSSGNIIPQTGSVFNPSTRIEVSPRIDLQLGQKDTLTLRYQYERGSQSGNLGGSTALPTTATSGTSSEHAIQFTDSHVINEHMVNETHFQYRRAFSSTTPVSTTPSISVSGDFSGGGSNGQFNTDHTDHLELQNMTTLSAGAHAIKFGTWLRDNRDANATNANFNGSFSFPSLQAYVATLNGLAQGQSIAQIKAACPASQTGGCIPNNLTYTTGRQAFVGNVFDGALYFQDDWKVTRKLTLNLGLRYTYYQPNHEISNPPKNSTFIPGLYNPAAQAQLNAGGYLIAGTGAWFHSFGNGLVECGANGIPPSCSLATEANVAPRFGFAYDPTGSGKTVIRGGYGLFYDLGGTGIAGSQSFESNAPTEFTSFAYNISGYTNITPGLLGPVALTVMPTKHKWMVVQQYNLTVQHEFPGKNLLSVGYVGTLSHHLPISVNINQIPEGVTTENVPALAGATGCDSLGNCNVQSILINKQHSSVFFVPYRGYTTILSEEGVSNSNYNALQAEFTHPFGHGLMVQASYAWSHSLDDASTYYSNTFFDSTNIERNYGSSDFNRPQSLLLSYVYSLPFFSHPSNTLLSKSLSQTLGGWRISGITSFFSGVPFTPTCGVSGYSTAINGSTLCNPVGPVKAQKSTISIPTYGPTPAVFSGSEIAQPLLSQLNSNGEPGMFGYLGKNVLTGPGRNNFDLALLKDFRMPWFGGERSRLEFRAETFNTFNHPNWDGLNTGCSGTTTFGQPCTGTANASLGAVNADWGPRALQLALKLTF